MIEAGADLSDACTKVENMLSTLPKDDLGRPILPRRGDGKLDMKELFDLRDPAPWACHTLPVQRTWLNSRRT